MAWWLTLLLIATTAQATSDWPDPESIVGVSVLVFEHAGAPKKTNAREGVTKFPDAIRVPTLAELWSEDKKRYNDQALHPPKSRPVMPWSMHNWLNFLHSGVLSQLNQPLTGPPLPPRPGQPLLNAPLLLRQAAALPPELEAMVARLRSSEAHTIYHVAHWYQVIERQTRSPKISVGRANNLLSVPWLDVAWWVDQTHQLPGAIHLTGFVQLTQSQFLRANLELWLHEAADQQQGPLRASHLYPTGFSVSHLKVSRSVEPNRWVYFDSESLGVLVKVSPQ